METVLPDIHGQAGGGWMVLPMLLFLSLISKRSNFTYFDKSGTVHFCTCKLREFFFRHLQGSGELYLYIALLETEIHRSENRGSVLSYQDSREGFLHLRCHVDPWQWLRALHSASGEMSASLNPCGGSDTMCKTSDYPLSLFHLSPW